MEELDLLSLTYCLNLQAVKALKTGLIIHHILIQLCLGILYMVNFISHRMLFDLIID